MHKATLRGAALLVGLSGYGFSMAVMVRAGLGLDPWDVFHQGLARHTGMTIGTASAVVGVAVLLAWIPLRNRPGIGTLANVIVIAVTVDAGLWLLPTPTSLPVRIAMMVGAVVLNAFSTVLYIGAALGPGPRDGLMTGLVVRTGLSVLLVRTSIEASVLALGWLLGGTVGVGTVLYAFGIGPLVQLFLRITPKRVLAVSGWASVAEARDLGVKTSGRRRFSRRDRESGELRVDRANVEDVIGEHACQPDGACPVAETRGLDLQLAGCQRQRAGIHALADPGDHVVGAGGELAADHHNRGGPTRRTTVANPPVDMPGAPGGPRPRPQRRQGHSRRRAGGETKRLPRQRARPRKAVPVESM